jgi:DNA-binding NarL/FixJ family response regulator
MPAMLPVIAVLNSDDTVLRAFQQVLEAEGFPTITAKVADFDSADDVAAFLARHRARVVVYDIAQPYDDQWAQFQRVYEASRIHGCQFLVTTTDRTALTRSTYPVGVDGMMASPVDMADLLRVLRVLLAAQDQMGQKQRDSAEARDDHGA